MLFITYFSRGVLKAVYFVDYHTAEEILVELPGFMYIIAFTLVAIAFFFTSIGIKKQKALRYFWYYYFFSSILLN